MRKYSCNSEQGVIYSAEVGDTRRARECFTEEIVTALALKGPGIDSVEKVLCVKWHFTQRDKHVRRHRSMLRELKMFGAVGS